MKRRMVLAALLLLVLSVTLVSQEVSERKEIAIFNLSYYDWTVPNEALGMIDSQIRNVFINLGRFDVVGMTYRLSSSDVQEFIETIREFKAANIEISEEVRLGQVTFTERDFNRLTGSFIVIIPSVVYYNSRIADNGNYTVEVETDFTFVNIEDARALAQFTVSTRGTDSDSAREAAKKAIDSIPMDLSFQVRSIPEFQLKSGILERNGSNVLIELGKNLGVVKGDEFAVISTSMLSSGHTFDTESALIIIKDVKDSVSYGKVIYSDAQIFPGDQVREIPRYGFEAMLYADVIAGLSDDELKLNVVPGIYVKTTRGFYAFSPGAGFELLIHDNLYVNTYFSVEANWRLWRLELNPQAGVGASLYYNFADADAMPQLSHINGFAKLRLNYLFSRDMKLTVSSGYNMFIGLSPFPSISGVSLGAGLTFKF